MYVHDPYEYSIARKITDEPVPDSQRASLADSQASLRENLAAQVAGAQNELSTSLIGLRSNGNADASLIAQGDAQLGALLALKQRLSTASPATLATIHAEIVAAVTAASNVAQQAQTALAGNSSGSAANLAAASQAARSAVTSFTEDFYEKKIFDPYLRFSSTEDEQRYRHDEAKRKEEIEKAMALHTSEGDLRANTLALDQLKDAGAHGADQSPDFEPMRRKLQASEAALSAAITSATLPSRKAEASAKDVADDVRPAVSVPDSVLAALRATGVKSADPEGEGHGVPAGKAPGSSVSLGG